MNDIKVMNRAADNIRVLAASMVEKANSGHPGGAMGGADFINVLFSEYLVYDPKTRNGKAGIATSKTRDTCRPCFIQSSLLPVNSPWKNCHNSANGEALLRVILK